MNPLSIRTLVDAIVYKIEYQLQLSNEPVKLLDLESKQLKRLINYGYAVDDNVWSLKQKYGNVFSIPQKKYLTKEQKLNLKGKL